MQFVIVSRRPFVEFTPVQMSHENTTRSRIANMKNCITRIPLSHQPKPKKRTKKRRKTFKIAFLVTLDLQLMPLSSTSSPQLSSLPLPPLPSPPLPSSGDQYFIFVFNKPQNRTRCIFIYFSFLRIRGFAAWNNNQLTSIWFPLSSADTEARQPANVILRRRAVPRVAINSEHQTRLLFRSAGRHRNNFYHRDSKCMTRQAKDIRSWKVNTIVYTQ